MADTTLGFQFDSCAPRASRSEGEAALVEGLRSGLEDAYETLIGRFEPRKAFLAPENDQHIEDAGRGGPSGQGCPQRLRDRDPNATPALRWLNERLEAEGLTTDQVVRGEVQQR